MAQKMTVTLEDDLDGGSAAETVRFGFEGTEYEIDLSAENAAAFREKLAPFIEHARPPARPSARRTGRTAAERRHGAAVRAWARQQGIAVSDRGRIPARVLNQYQAARSFPERTP